MSKFAFDSVAILNSIDPAILTDWRSQGSVKINNVFSWWWEKPDDPSLVSIGDIVEAESAMYRHHFRETVGTSNLGWQRSQVYSIGQQLLRQDPYYYTIYTCLRPDKNWRLVSFPVYCRHAEPGDSTAFQHVDLSRLLRAPFLRDASLPLSGQVQGTLSIDDEEKDDCGLMVLGLDNVRNWSARVFRRWFVGTPAGEESFQRLWTGGNTATTGSIRRSDRDDEPDAAYERDHGDIESMQGGATEDKENEQQQDEEEDDEEDEDNEHDVDDADMEEEEDEEEESEGDEEGGSKTYKLQPTIQDLADLGPIWTPTPGKRGSVRISSAALPYKDVGPCKRRRRTMLQWFVALDEDHSCPEFRSTSGQKPDWLWSLLSRAHRDRETPGTASSRVIIDSPFLPDEFVPLPFAFPGSISIEGLGGLSDALVGRIRWTDARAVDERNIHLGVDRDAARRRIEDWRATATRVANAGFARVISAEVDAYGENSYFQGRLA